MRLLKIYFSDVKSYYEVKCLARHILNRPNKILFYIKTHVIKRCEDTNFEDFTAYYWHDFNTNSHYVAFISNISNFTGIKIYISDYEFRQSIIGF